MVKRVVAFALLFAVIFSLGACGNVPDDMTKETYVQGKNALKVMDDYLDGKLNAYEAEKKLSAIFDAIELEQENINPDPSSENYSDELIYSMSISTVGFCVSGFVLGMFEMENSVGVVSDCQQLRDILYSSLYGQE